MTTNKDSKKVTKMTRSQLNEMINYQIDQKVVNYIVESQGITLNEASKQLNESAKDGFKALKQACKNQAVKAAIFAATKSLQGAAALLDGEAKTDMQSMVNVLMALTAEQTGNQAHAYGNGIQKENAVQESFKNIKKKLYESEQESYYTEIDGLNSSVICAQKVDKIFLNGIVGAYDPSVKGNPQGNDWEMYAVKIRDIKNAQCVYYGNLSKFGIPNYLSSKIILFGHISFIKAGNGQNWEQEFAGKLVISYNPNNHSLFFEPWQFSGNYNSMSPSSDTDSFSHFANRGVVVRTNDVQRQINADDTLKNLIDNLCLGYYSDNAIKYLVKQGYIKIENGEIKSAKTNDTNN